jgi:hypothetical protein
MMRTQQTDNGFIRPLVAIQPAAFKTIVPESDTLVD